MLYTVTITEAQILSGGTTFKGALRSRFERAAGAFLNLSMFRARCRGESSGPLKHFAENLDKLRPKLDIRVEEKADTFVVEHRVLHTATPRVSRGMRRVQNPYRRLCTDPESQGRDNGERRPGRAPQNAARETKVLQ
jgi:hypothetical protein